MTVIVHFEKGWGGGGGDYVTRKGQMKCMILRIYLEIRYAMVHVMLMSLCS